MHLVESLLTPNTLLGFASLDAFRPPKSLRSCARAKNNALIQGRSRPACFFPFLFKHSAPLRSTFSAVHKYQATERSTLCGNDKKDYGATTPLQEREHALFSSLCRISDCLLELSHQPTSVSDSILHKARFSSGNGKS